MRYTIFTIIVLLVAAFGWSAAKKTTRKNEPHFEVRAINFDSIKGITRDANASTYYPRLMQMFRENDTTRMSFREYRFLYYGYVFQEDYNPYRTSEFSEKIEDLYYKKNFTRAECDSIEKYADLTLHDNVFDLSQMKFYAFALGERGKIHRSKVWQYRLKHIIAAILSSGNGTKEQPWIVISPDHEYNIVNFLGFTATDHQDMGDGIDFIAVKKRSDKDPDGFYFDVNKMNEITAVKFK